MLNDSERLQLIKDATQGNTDAFEKLYRLKIKNILYHTANLLNNRADVEDMAQEVVMQMFESITRLEHPEAFNSWLYQIIKHICYRQNSKQGNKTKHEDSVEASEIELQIADNDIEVLPAPAAERKERDLQIFAAISQLPQRQRETLAMYYYDDMPYKDIAEAQGISINTVSTNMLKAKQALKERLEATMQAPYQPDASNIPDTPAVSAAPAIPAVPDAQNQENTLACKNDKLLGVAAGPLITEAFNEGIDNTFSPQFIQHLQTVCDAQLAALVASGALTAGTTVAVGVASATSKIVTAAVVGILSVSVAIGIGAASGAISINAQQTDPVPIVQTIITTTPGIPYTPSAKIISEKTDGTVVYSNPAVVRLEVETPGAVVLKWQIVASNNDILAQGTGSIITGELQQLPPGTYSAEWQAASSDAPDAPTAWIKRDFQIS